MLPDFITLVLKYPKIYHRYFFIDVTCMLY